MRPIGFSSGALARGDFRRALELAEQVREEAELAAVELSALRRDELEPLLAALPELLTGPLASYAHVSFHAPSRFPAAHEAALARRLAEAVPAGWPIVVHPDAISRPELWRPLGSRLLVENMDGRKKGRTAFELGPLFARLPEARFCLDLAHARQVDPSLGEAAALLDAFGDRLAEIHLSRIDPRGTHHRLDQAAIDDLRTLAHRLPENVPVLLESPLDRTTDGSALTSEVAAARRALHEGNR